MLGDLSVRLANVKAFYSDEGWFPLRVLFESPYWSNYHFTFSAINGALWFQYLLFGIGFVFAVGLLLGKNTRLSTFMCWLFLVSIHNRNILVMQGGDDFMRLTFFWAMFLPLGKMWSLDQKGKQVETFEYYSLANIGYILLLFSVYFFSALMKHSPEWYTEGTALYYAFSIEQLTYPLAKVLYPYEGLLKILTFCTIYVELLVPFFLLIPWKNSLFRKLYFFLFLGLHLGIGLTLQVGYFFLISIVCMMAILPGTLAQRIMNLPEKLGSSRLSSFLLNLKPPSLGFEIQGALPGIKVNKALKNGIVVFAIGFSLLWNMGNILSMPTAIGQVVKPIGALTRLSQNWGMFAPTVFKADGWYIYKARMSDGKTIDILNKTDTVDYNKPKWPVFQYKNAKWRKIGENMIRESNKGIRLPFCQYILKEYNQSHSNNTIDSLEIIYMREMSMPDYFVPQPEKGLLCKCWTK
jgi:hypothetical protein